MRARIAPLLLATLTMSTLALTHVGCQVTPPVEPRADPYASPQVSLAGNNLRRWTAVLPPSVQRDDAGNNLFVSLPIRNTQNKAFTVDYQAAFYDANGGLLEQTGWMPLYLEANSPATIQAHSTTSRAADFHLSLRLAK